MCSPNNPDNPNRQGPINKLIETSEANRISPV